MQTAQGPFPPEVLNRMNQVIAVLRSKGALKDDRCPSCGTDNWNVDFLAIPSAPLPNSPTTIGPAGARYVFGMSIGSLSGYIPTATFICTNCGYTKMYNLNVLGLWGA